ARAFKLIELPIVWWDALVVKAFYVHFVVFVNNGGESLNQANCRIRYQRCFPRMKVLRVCPDMELGIEQTFHPKAYFWSPVWVYSTIEPDHGVRTQAFGICLHKSGQAWATNFFFALHYDLDIAR